MSGNEEVKRKAAELLEEGGIFAFGLSEQAHGADLYSTEMILVPQDGRHVSGASGDKYYIGNANEAALVSVFGKVADADGTVPSDHKSSEYVFFVVDPRHEKYELHQERLQLTELRRPLRARTTTRSPRPRSSPRHARPGTPSLNTVNVGKFNLGWASIGICTHAFYEAIDHAADRRLFDHAVTDFPAHPPVLHRRLLPTAWR